MNPTKDITGQKFHRLTVIKRLGNHLSGKAIWLCQCECGTNLPVIGVNLRSGNTKSCGCLSTELFIQRVTTHGATYTRLYVIWSRMKARCYNKNSSDFEYYGGRGIKICDEWFGDFTSFKNWAMNHGYKDNLTIDRIEVNGNYDPLNCRWATRSMQRYNQRERKERIK